MKNLNLKKIAAAILTVAVLLTTTACAARQKPAEDTAAEPQTTQQTTVPDAEQQTFRIGICNYVDDASLNQIVENIQTRLAEISEETGVQFAVDYDNCNADATVMEQIIANFQSNGADLLVGVATPVAMRMQTATEDSRTPVVFAAVSDPVGAGLVQSLEAPGSNVTGTSDYLDTAAVMNLIFAANPDAAKIGLLYDAGQDSSTAAIASAKAYLDEKGIAYVEHRWITGGHPSAPTCIRPDGFRPPSKVHSPYAVPLHSHRRQLSDARFCKGTPLSQRFHWYFVVGAIIVTARLEVNRQFKRKKDGDRAAISAFGFCGALSGFPFEKVGARERIVQSLYRYTTQVQPNGSGRVPHWMPVNSS